MPKKDEAKPKLAQTHEIVADEHARTALKVDEKKILEAKINEVTNLDTRNNRDFAGMIRRGAGIAARDAI